LPKEIPIKSQRRRKHKRPSQATEEVDTQIEDWQSIVFLADSDLAKKWHAKI
jgi:hypothetical protein